MNWISITTPPEDRELYIVALNYIGDKPIKDRWEIDCLYYSGGRWETCDGIVVDDKNWPITHYMPMPEPPKETT